MSKVTYKDAGVDLDVYDEAMTRLPRLMHRTFSPRVLKLDGGFAGLFQLDFANRLFARNYDDPVLVACTDGVGTKLKVAQRCGKHDTVGIDLVAMSVNDALCCGAEPLLFLDYVAMSHDDPPVLEQLVKGVSDGCIQADCACWAARRRSCRTCTSAATTIWPASAWAWSNGSRSSTANRSCPETCCSAWPPAACTPTATAWCARSCSSWASLDVHDHVECLGTTVGEALLTPTRIYAQPVRKILRHYKVKIGRTRHRAHHRRRFAGQPGTHPARRRASPHRRRQLARAARVPVAAAAGRHRRRRDGSTCSTWASGWCWSSARTTPRASSECWPTAAWTAGKSAKSFPLDRLVIVLWHLQPRIYQGGEYAPVMSSSARWAERSGFPVA